jgi:hypothetical protein
MHKQVGQWMSTPTPSFLQATGFEGYCSPIPSYAWVAIGIFIGVLGTMCAKKFISNCKNCYINSNYRLDSARQLTCYSAINFVGPGCSEQAPQLNPSDAIEIEVVDPNSGHDHNRLIEKNNNSPCAHECRIPGKSIVLRKMLNLHPKSSFLSSPKSSNWESDVSEDEEKIRNSLLSWSSNSSIVRMSNLGPGSALLSRQFLGDLRQPEGSCSALPLQCLKSDGGLSIPRSKLLSVELQLEGSTSRSEVPNLQPNIKSAAKEKTLPFDNVKASEPKLSGYWIPEANPLSNWLLPTDMQATPDASVDYGGGLTLNSLKGEIPEALPVRSSRIASAASTVRMSLRVPEMSIVEEPSAEESLTPENFDEEENSSSKSERDELKKTNSVFVLEKKSKVLSQVSNDSYLSISSATPKYLFTPGTPSRSSGLDYFTKSKSRQFGFPKLQNRLSMERNRPISVKPLASLCENKVQDNFFEAGSYPLIAIDKQ